MAEYEIMVCPVCLGQVEPEYEGPTGHHHDGYAGTVGPVMLTVPAFYFSHGELEKAIEAVQPKLEEQRQEEAERRKKRVEWEALSEEERERIRAERWAATSPMEKALHEQFGLSKADLIDQLGRQAYGEFVRIPVKPSE